MDKLELIINAILMTEKGIPVVDIIEQTGSFKDEISEITDKYWRMKFDLSDEYKVLGVRDDLNLLGLSQEEFEMF